MLMDVNKEIDMLHKINDGINFVKEKVEIGQNMSPEGFNVMDLTQQWLKRELELLIHKQNELIQASFKYYTNTRC